MGSYITNAKGNPERLELILSSKGKSSLVITPPSEFGGVDDQWSPEDLFSASISSCYILTFKFLARSKKLDWESIDVHVDAKLEKVERGFRFTQVVIEPHLTVCCSSDVDPYLEILTKAKETCLVTNSMNCEFTVNPKIKVKAK